MDNFTVILPSNVINHNYENTLSNYKTRLAAPLELNGEWYVGMSAISYTKSWTHKTEKEYIGVYYYEKGITYTHEEKYIEIDLSEHSDAMSVLIDIKGRREEIQKNADYMLPNITFNESLNRIEMQLGMRRWGPAYFSFSSRMAKILGIEESHYNSYIEKILGIIQADFEKYDSELRKVFERSFKPQPLDNQLKLYIASSPMNLDIEYKNLYIYCDFIEHGIVGSSNRPLLRIVEVPHNSKDRQQISFNYTDIQYHKANFKKLQDLLISIKDRDLNLIPFTFGRVIITLHFKKHE